MGQVQESVAEVFDEIDPPFRKAVYKMQADLHTAMVQKTDQEFTIKDSGERREFASGMVRDTETEKVDYTLALDGPMFKRYAAHLTKGAKKYSARNWMLAEGQEELDRFRQSALRHFIQWFEGDVDEDHASAIWFNVNGAEYVKEKMK